jgi:RND family efflux transporter MFP subunit
MLHLRVVKSLAFYVGAAALLLVAAGGCHWSVPGSASAATPKDKKKDPPPAAAVTWMRPVACDFTPVEEFTGQIQAHKTVQLRARVSGYLDEILFSDGQLVKAGQDLFQIDPDTYQAEVDKAQASIRQAETRLARLKLQYQRAMGLVQNNTITKEEFERIEADKDEAEAAVDAAHVDLKIANINLDFTKIKAPLAGRIGMRAVDKGNLIKADDTLLATIMELDPIYAYFEIDERTALAINQALAARAAAQDAPSTKQEVKLLLIDQTEAPVNGVIEFEPEAADSNQTLRIREPADDDTPKRKILKGQIDFRDNELDTGTGTLRMRAEVENKNGLLTPGFFIRCRLPMAEKRTGICVPEEALGSDQGQRFLYVLKEDGLVEQRRVELGPLLRVTAGPQLRNNIRQATGGKLDPGQSSLSWRVIEDGLAPEERVIVSNLQRVRPGENKVRFVEEPKYSPPE